MAHNDFVREDGQWPPETVPTARDWALFDRAQSKGLNLPVGDTWAPSSPIVIGGAGLVLAAGWVRGAVRTESGGRLVLGDDDYVQVTPARTRVLVMPFGFGARSPDSEFAREMSVDPHGLRFTDNPGNLVYWPIPPEMVHDGATLVTAILRFRVGQPHASLPANLPAFFVARLSLGHEVGTAAFVSPLVAGAGSGIQPTPTTAEQYYAGGSAQAMSVTCDTANVIDASSYSYVIAFADEYGTGALPGNIYHSLELHFTNINDLRPE